MLTQFCLTWRHTKIWEPRSIGVNEEMFSERKNIDQGYLPSPLGEIPRTRTWTSSAILFEKSHSTMFRNKMYNGNRHQ